MKNKNSEKNSCSSAWLNLPLVLLANIQKEIGFFLHIYNVFCLYCFSFLKYLILIFHWSNTFTCFKKSNNAKITYNNNENQLPAFILLFPEAASFLQLFLLTFACIFHTVPFAVSILDIICLFSVATIIDDYKWLKTAHICYLTIL